jgi:hypothetical protein
MKSKEFITGASYRQICGKEILRNLSRVDCCNKLETKKKKKPNNKKENTF